MLRKDTDILKDIGYELVIGIEIHVQLKTNTKIFCGCMNYFEDEPNKNICEICSGQPGSLPVLNRKVIDCAIAAGIATNCTIRNSCVFARKHYFYPDLPKNYQITQDKTPICENGYLPVITDDGDEKKIRIARIHMEEDAGKNIHGKSGKSFVNLNRAGTPLLEIVTHPDISNTTEAYSYLTRLHSLVRYLGISDANMEQGSFRGDVNISIKPRNQKELGTKVELKNVNSFRFIVQAINYEIERQVNAVQNGEKIVQETRSWDSSNHKTVRMRSKETAQDYHYFPDPDLPEIVVDEQWINEIKKNLPELGHVRYSRFKKDFDLSSYESDIISKDKELSKFFEEAAKIAGNPKGVCNWILRDLLGYLKEHKIGLSECKITPKHLSGLVLALDKGVINSKVAQDIFIEMATTGKIAENVIEEKGLKQIDSEDELQKIVMKIIDKNPKNVALYKSGKDRLFGFFVGQVMKETKGKGNPKIITMLLKKYLS
jgi:aspartyl-tRNA(Asn)/glutamyl-tRNA(Gln) amidotransferase subunit B